MSYEAWGEPDGRPYPTPAQRRIRVREGDFRGFEGRTPCAPYVPTGQCPRCSRFRPALLRVTDRDTLLIDGTTVTPKGEPCRMFFPKELDL